MITEIIVIISTFMWSYSCDFIDFIFHSLQWRHTERDGVSNHKRFDYLLSHLFGRRSKQIKLRVTGPLVCEGIHWWPVNSPHKGPVTRKNFPFDSIILIIYHRSSSLGSMLVNFLLQWSTCCFLYVCLAIDQILRTNLLIFGHPTRNIPNINEIIVAIYLHTTSLPFHLIYIAMLFTIILVHRDRQHCLIFHHNDAECVAVRLI